MTKIRFTDMTEEELNAFITRVEDAIEYNLTLEKKDLIQRKSIKENKRANQITLTKEGEDILERTQMVVKGFREHFHSKLNKEEIKTLFMLLNKLTHK